MFLSKKRSKLSMRTERRIFGSAGVLSLFLSTYMLFMSPYGSLSMLYSYDELTIPCDTVFLGEAVITCDDEKNKFYVDGIELEPNEYVNNIMMVSQVSDAAVSRKRKLATQEPEYMALSISTPPEPKWTETRSQSKDTQAAYQSDSVYFAADVTWERGYGAYDSRVKWTATSPERIYFFDKIPYDIHSGTERIFSPSKHKLDTVGEWNLRVSEMYKIPGKGTEVLPNKEERILNIKERDPEAPEPPEDTEGPIIKNCQFHPSIKMTDENVVVNCYISDVSGIMSIEGYVNNVPAETFSSIGSNRWEGTFRNRYFSPGENHMKIRAIDKKGNPSTRTSVIYKEGNVPTTTTTTTTLKKGKTTTTTIKTGTTTTTTLYSPEPKEAEPVELCGNNIDDDGNGMIDTEDSESLCYVLGEDTVWSQVSGYAPFIFGVLGISSLAYGFTRKSKKRR